MSVPFTQIIKRAGGSDPSTRGTILVLGISTPKAKTTSFIGGGRTRRLDDVKMISSPEPKQNAAGLFGVGGDLAPALELVNHSRFNEYICTNLVKGMLKQHGGKRGSARVRVRLDS